MFNRKEDILYIKEKYEKIYLMFISLFLTISSTITIKPIKASTEVSYSIKDDYGNEILEIISVGSTSESEWFDYIDSENNKIYRSELNGNTVTVTDLSDNSVC